MSPAKNHDFKTESAARTHARKSGLNMDTLVIETNDEGRFIYYDSAAKAEPVEETPAAPAFVAELGGLVEFGPPAPDAQAAEDAEVARRVEAETRDAEGGRIMQPSDVVTMRAVIEDAYGDDWGPKRWDEAQDFARMIADAEKCPVALLDDTGREVARFEPNLPETPAEPEAPAAAPAEEPAAPASEITRIELPAQDTDEGMTPNGAEPTLPPLEGGYFLRLRTPYDARAAMNWAGIHARALTKAHKSRIDIEVVNPATGEVVFTARGAKEKVARTMGDASTVRASKGDAASASEKTPRVTRKGLAEKGEIPPAPTFGSEARQAKYGDKLQALKDVVASHDLERIRAFTAYEGKLAGGYRALEGWRQQVIRALEIRATSEVKEAA